MRSSSRRGRGGGEEGVETMGGDLCMSDGSWILVDITTVVLGIELHDWVQDWTFAHIRTALRISKSMALALGFIGFVHNVGVFWTTTTCTCLCFTNNGIHDSTPGLQVHASQY